MIARVRRLKAILPLLLLLVAGAILYLSGSLDSLHPQRLLADEHSLQGAIRESPWLMRAAYTGMLTLAVATGIPGTILIIFTGGMLFGIVLGTLLSAIGLVLGSLLLFLASCYAFRSGERTPPLLAQRLRHGFLAHPASYTLFLRLVPVFPFGAVSVALAWLRCPLWIFLGASAFGGTVMIAFETAIGAGIAAHIAAGEALDASLLMQPSIILPLICMAALALLPILLSHRQKSLDSRVRGNDGNRV